VERLSEKSQRGPQLSLTATVESIDPAAFTDQAAIDYVLAVRILHAGSVIMTDAVGATETMLFGPFWSPYTGQIHAQSVASTLFGQSRKVNPEKSGSPVGPKLIHATESLCTTTTCSHYSRCVRSRKSHPHGFRRAIHAGSCKRTSENFPSTHSAE
jgi:hypothetical protein